MLPSSEHSKVESGSLDEKVKVAVVSRIGPPASLVPSAGAASGGSEAAAGVPTVTTVSAATITATRWRR